LRGYGLKDSERVKAACGDNVKLQVANAAAPREAAKIYPVGYWTALIHPPAKEELPPAFHSQEQWLAAFRAGCNHCHQIGMVADFSTDGTLWFSASSGYLGRLDLKTGKFTSRELPGAKFAGTGKETGSTEYPYFLWVDQFDTLGLG